MRGYDHAHTFVFVLFSLSLLGSGCAAPDHSSADLAGKPLAQADSSSGDRSHSSSVQDKHNGHNDKQAAAEENDRVPRYLIRYSFRSDQPLYLVIENKYVDHGGIPGLLTYTTKVSDRATIIQRVISPVSKKTTKHDPQPWVNLSWEYDRYEVREKGMKGTTAFDSLRDLYPKSQLRQLGSVPGSKVTFSILPETGKTKDIRVTLGRSVGPASRKKLSRTSRRCLVSKENLEQLLDDCGALFIPFTSVRVGQSWSNRRIDTSQSGQEAVIDYMFTLKNVRQIEDRKIADIEMTGKVHLQPNPSPRLTPTPHRRVQRLSGSKKRDYKIEKALCKGSIEFDLTRGELRSLIIQRELGLSAKMESKNDKPMKLETGSSHRLRVEVRHTPPPKPVIVGGPKPPEEEVVDQGRNKPTDRRKANRASAAARQRSINRRSAARQLQGTRGRLNGRNVNDQRRFLRELTTRPVQRRTKLMFGADAQSHSSSSVVRPRVPRPREEGAFRHSTTTTRPVHPPKVHPGGKDKREPPPAKRGTKARHPRKGESVRGKSPRKPTSQPSTRPAPAEKPR